MPRRAAKRATRRLQVTSFGCDALKDAEPQALGITYWFETPPDGKPYRVSISFTGRRIGVKGKPGRRDTFTVTEDIDGVIPGSGPMAVTTRVHDVAPGEWHVTATGQTKERAAGHLPGKLPRASSSGTTAFPPVIKVRAPGAGLGVWPALVTVGVGVALTLMSVLARRAHLPTTRILLVSLVASMVGLVGAKAYYIVEHRTALGRVSTAGLCIQGFVLGAVGTLVAGAALVDIPVGRLLDVAVPGLLLAMAIGRLGCFFGGCCAGRPTGSRWGLWSSDRHLGVRRIPTQLLEAAMAAAIGLVALLIVWSGGSKPSGMVFVAAISAYTLGRQLLFPLRDLPRHTAHCRKLTMVAAVVVLVVAVLMLT